METSGSNEQIRLPPIILLAKPLRISRTKKCIRFVFILSIFDGQRDALNSVVSIA